MHKNLVIYIFLCYLKNTKRKAKVEVMSSIDTKCGPQKSFDTADKSFSSREELFTSSSFLSLQNYYHTH